MENRSTETKQKGYALITVLLMVALMSVMIIGLFILVQDDRTRARSYMEVGRSRFLTDMATQEVLAKIMDGSKVQWEAGKAVASYTAAPGGIEMRKYKEPINKGYHKTSSELISVSTQDITELHTALNPKNSSVGWTILGGGYTRTGNRKAGFLGKYGTYFQPYQGFAASETHNGHPGSYIGTGIYANAPVVLCANQISTSANVFTDHIVTQAIRDTGNKRVDFTDPAENTNTGVGFMDHDDEVLGEQWSQVVIARIPGDGLDQETGGPKFDYRILYSRTLDHQAQ